MKTLRLLAVLFLLPAAAMAGEPATVRTVKGDTIKGDLVSVSEKELVLSESGKRVTMPLTDILDVSLVVPPSPTEGSYTDIGLVDGSLLHCVQFLVRQDRVEARTIGGQEVRLPLQGVAYLLHDAQDPKIREEWQGLAAKKSNLDFFAVKDAEGQVNLVEGTFGEGNDAGTGIHFESSAGIKRELSLSRLHGIAFARKASPDAPAAVCKIVDAGRDVFLAMRAVSAGDRLQIVTVAGAQAELALSGIARLDYTQGKLAYLSDLEPVKVVEHSNVGGWDEHYRRDRNIDDKPLMLVTRADTRADVQTFPKGLAIHATTELVYDLGGQYREFKAILGVDPSVGEDKRARDDVRVIIEADGQPLFEREVKRQDNPIPVTLDVRGVRQLHLIVRPAGVIDLGNHVNLADARVLR